MIDSFVKLQGPQARSSLRGVSPSLAVVRRGKARARSCGRDAPVAVEARASGGLRPLPWRTHVVPLDRGGARGQACRFSACTEAPGANWLHMKPYEALADERRVVFYDQLGAGQLRAQRAARPGDVDARAVRGGGRRGAELRSASSACTSSATPGAGCSGMQYASGRPAGLASLIVESSPASVPDWMPEVQRLRSELPPEVESDAARARGGGHDRRPRLRGGGDGLLQAPPLPRRPMAGLARRVLHRSSRPIPRSTTR